MTSSEMLCGWPRKRASISEAPSDGVQARDRSNLARQNVRFDMVASAPTPHLDIPAPSAAEMLQNHLPQ